MAIYEFESETGDRIEEEFPIGTAPAEVTRDGARYRRVISSFMANLNYEDQSLRERRLHDRVLFEQPDPHNPGGLSDAELVKKGHAKTKDMSTWV